MTTSDLLKRLRDDPVFFTWIILKMKMYPYQEKLLRATSKRIVAVWGRQSGKTTCIAIKVIHHVYTHPNHTVLIVSKGLRQSIIMYTRITNMILGNGILRNSVLRYTRTQIFLKNGAQIIALPCSQDGANLRGYTADMVIMDEAAFMPETVIMNVIFPMLATTGGTAILLSTPWGRSHIFYRSFINPMYWVQHVKSEECPSISKDFLKEQRYNIGELRYKIEYEAEFIEDANALFPQDLIRRCTEKWNEKLHYILTDKQIKNHKGKFVGRFVLGCDLGKRFDHSVIVIMKRETLSILDEETGRPIKVKVWRLIYMKRFPLRTKLSVCQRHIEWLGTKFNFRNACIDETGIGAKVVEDLQETCPWVEGVLLYSAQAKQTVVMYAYTRMERDMVCLPFDRDLITEINEQCFSYSYVRSKSVPAMEEKGVMTFWHPEGRHDDRLWALMLALYATETGRVSGVVL